MNLLTNGAFDIGSDGAPWGLANAYVDTTGICRTPPNCAVVASARYVDPFPTPHVVLIEGSIFQYRPVVADVAYVLSAWVKRTASPWGDLVLLVDSEEVARLPETGGSDWEYLAGVFSPDSDKDIGATVKALAGSGDGIQQWLVDDCKLEIGGVMPRGLINSYKSLMTRLKTMNGGAGGFYYDLSSRVIPRYAEPGDMPAAKLPYICLPMNDTGGYRAVEGSHVIATMRQDIVMFVADTERILNDDNAPIAALKAHDDILRCLMPTTGVDWNLGDANIIDVRPVAKEIIAGTNDGPQWCGIRVTLEIDCIFGRSDLGPSA